MAGLIVVGVDGSDSSVEALHWAVGQANETGSSVEAVAVWTYPMVFGYPPPLPPDWDPQHDAQGVLASAVAEAIGSQASSDIRQKVAEGPPGPTLVELSKDADLLVVGSRGHGLVAGVMLGSVSEYCSLHSACPVVIVRHRSQ